ncbi:DUF6065 family protein [Bosea sp. TAB14]|uniref:DUF6065 family protein n=1 Tax=Bosea sp. TAB14 TaxID=3237481 RepID=UPI003F9044C6
MVLPVLPALKAHKVLSALWALPAPDISKGRSSATVFPGDEGRSESTMMTGPRLDCYALSDRVPQLVAAPTGRDWMHATSEHFAYRRTPLAIASANGWELLNPAGFCHLERQEGRYDSSSPAGRHIEEVSWCPKRPGLSTPWCRSTAA